MIAITGGGTGGHLVIAKALKEEFNKLGIKPIYIGSSKGQDKLWFENSEGFEDKYFLNSQGVVNQKGLKKLISLFYVLKLLFTCRDIFKKHNIKKVICVGGYSAAPASICAVILGKKLYIHEQNAISGKLNTLLKPFAKAFFSSYNTLSPCSDYPVNQTYFNYARIRKEFKNIIFLGGSQGANSINVLAMQMAPILKKHDIGIIHQTGSKEFDEVNTFYKNNDIKADVFAFSDTLAQKMAEADFAISRSGASTLWELCACGLPSLFIPYQHAAKNHQYHNVLPLLKDNLAQLRMQNDLNPDKIWQSIKNLNLELISQNLMTKIKPFGAKKIVDYIMEN
ncbi:MAG: UDP-N-acetylglucosamine--N-acetylmuramyl-(pentapeptide) pyrophosphoryl-undecaprenol N-acetylglucosamine transferase [Sulfurospirillaceae bacterium]|nr:UDP-N-acetylglucosamine--N-acetylmuramyl-(pentapeptide) pyrophosphoryl-undecaprenol N-acetylglucosamine transferase [Sulfurospirillaceae bacterium]